LKQLEYKFLVATLGKDGALAIKKAITVVPEISNIIFPRTMIAWVNGAIEAKYSGAVPELDDVSINASLPDRVELLVKGQKISVSRVEAMARLTQMFSGDIVVDFQNKPKTILDLGKTIDLLIKSNFKP
jgi:hypothetical protein